MQTSRTSAAAARAGNSDSALTPSFSVLDTRLTWTPNGLSRCSIAAPIAP